MIVLITGSRDGFTKKFVHQKLTEIHKETPITLLVVGGARGVDKFAEQWAIGSQVDFEVFLADWHIHGESAGIRRNVSMGYYIRRESEEKGIPCKCIAFRSDHSSGTSHMIKFCATNNIPVCLFDKVVDMTFE